MSAASTGDMPLRIQPRPNETPFMQACRLLCWWTNVTPVQPVWLLPCSDALAPCTAPSTPCMRARADGVRVAVAEQKAKEFSRLMRRGCTRRAARFCAWDESFVRRACAASAHNKTVQLRAHEYVRHPSAVKCVAIPPCSPPRFASHARACPSLQSSTGSSSSCHPCRLQTRSWR